MDSQQAANKTPKTKIVEKMLHVNSDSPFRCFPKFSTPPSRFMKIFNPFNVHLVEKLHLPLLNNSPTVFTPQESEGKFKWSIDDISTLKPADIDEATLDQHVFEEDPHLESIVQEKINTFFSEKQIVPSPLNTNTISSRLLPRVSPSTPSSSVSNGATQTMLSLPPNLPDHVEEALKPYFSFNDETEVKDDLNPNSSLHRKLFDFQSPEPVECSNIPSELSLELTPHHVQITHMHRNNSSLGPLPDLNECELSPISRKPSKLSRSACRLSFSGRMSVDVSLVVPDIENISNISKEGKNLSGSSESSNSNSNWDMEYKQISLSPHINNSIEHMEITNNTTPHSKLFTSQRKRLSESFKDEEEKENVVKIEENRRVKKQLIRNEEDTGYLTASPVFREMNWDAQVFASTPSKKNSQVY